MLSKNWKSIVAFLCILLVIVYTSIVFLPHAHDCVGSDCTVCALIEASRNTMIGLVCSISMGNKMDYSAMSMDDPNVNFVGRSADNNGVAGKVDFVFDDKGNVIKPYKAGCITVALGGSLGASYLQVEDFYTSQNVSVLEFEDGVSDSAKLFITTCIMNESKYKYFPFGRELNTHIRTDFGFTLPIKRKTDGTPIIDKTFKYSPKGYIPDWQWMESYMKSLPYGDRI